jgi:hypothetical protein
MGWRGQCNGSLHAATAPRGQGASAASHNSLPRTEKQVPDRRWPGDCHDGTVRPRNPWQERRAPLPPPKFFRRRFP